MNRDEALCKLFMEPYNAENVYRNKRRIRNLGDVEICFAVNNPIVPLVINRFMLFQRPFEYHEYEPSYERFEGEQFTVDFINQIYRPNNQPLYQREYVRINDIFELVKLHSDFFGENTTIEQFTAWCHNHHLRFLEVEEVNRNGELARPLFVLIRNYHDVWIMDVKDVTL